MRKRSEENEAEEDVEDGICSWRLGFEWFHGQSYGPSPPSPKHTYTHIMSVLYIVCVRVRECKPLERVG